MSCAVVKRLPVLNYNAVFIFWSFGIGILENLYLYKAIPFRIYLYEY